MRIPGSYAVAAAVLNCAFYCTPASAQAVAERALLDALEKPAAVVRDADVPLERALQDLMKERHISFELDRLAFLIRLGVKDVGKEFVIVQKSADAPLRFVLDVLLKQVKGRYEVRGGKLVIVPLPNGWFSFHPVRDRVKERGDQNLAIRALKKPVYLEKGVDRSHPLEILTYFSDRYDVCFLFDCSAFPNADARLDPQGDARVELPPTEGEPLEKVLDKMLDQIHAQFEVRQGVYLITPKPKSPELPSPVMK
jgi:hypothetical protein